MVRSATGALRVTMTTGCQQQFSRVCAAHELDEILGTVEELHRVVEGHDLCCAKVSVERMSTRESPGRGWQQKPFAIE